MLPDYNALRKETDFKPKFEKKQIQFQTTNFKFGYFGYSDLTLRPIDLSWRRKFTVICRNPMEGKKKARPSPRRKRRALLVAQQN
jgi:hypothetical protein